MDNDSYTEITNRSWFNRLGNAFKGILVGMVLVLIAFGLLFWNEGRAVERYKTLKEGGGAVLSVQSTEVDPENAGKLIHLSGRAETRETLTDPDFGISTKAIKLIRDVQMYQWQESSKSETKKKLGGGEETVTTYSYSKNWSSQTISSSSFKQPKGHQNPGTMPFHFQTIVASEVRVGAFRMSDSLISKLSSTSPFPIPPVTELPQELANRVVKQGNSYYFGNPEKSEIGDLRITYAVVLPSEISLVSRQVRSTFEPYHAAAGGTIELLEMGIHSAESMFQKAQQSNTILTWAIRIGGFILMALGLSMTLAPLAVFGDVVPVIGSIIGAGTNLIAALLAAFLSFITIGVAWIVYRPLLGISILVLALGIGVFLFMKVKKSDPVLPPPLPATPPPPIPKVK